MHIYTSDLIGNSLSSVVSMSKPYADLEICGLYMTVSGKQSKGDTTTVCSLRFVCKMVVSVVLISVNMQLNQTIS